MRKFLLALFALVIVTGVSIGSPEPDRPNPEPIEFVLSQDVDQVINLDVPVLIQVNQFDNEYLSTIDQDNLENSLSEPDPAFKLVKYWRICGKVDKPKDNYRMPIWEYLPTIEPPANLSRC